PAIFRAEAALGQAHDDLLRTPWLPNKLLEWGLAQTEADRVDLRDATHIRLRFPGLLSALLLVACAGIWARLRNATHAQAAWIALLCAAWPSTIAAVRSVSTTLWGDLGIVMMLLAVTRAYAPASSKRTSILSILFAGLG